MLKMQRVCKEYVVRHEDAGLKGTMQGRRKWKIKDVYQILWWKCMGRGQAKVQKHKQKIALFPRDMRR